MIRRFNDWIERNEKTAISIVMLLLLLMVIVLLSGCVSTETRSEARRVLERTETPTADGGKIVRETERSESGSETVTKADVTAAVQAGLSALRGDIPGLISTVIPKVPTVRDIADAVPKPVEQKILGMGMPEILLALSALWGGERTMAVYHKRRRQKEAVKP